MSMIEKQNSLVDHDLIINQMSAMIATAFSEGKDSKLLRLELPVTDIDPLTWLGAQKNTTCTYWSNRDNSLRMAGVGMADEFVSNGATDFESVVRHVHAQLGDDSNGRYFGGFAFRPENPTVDDTWQSFGNCRFLLPRFEILSERGETKFICNLLASRDRHRIPNIITALQAISFIMPVKRDGIYQFVRQSIEPNESEWTEIVNSALDRFNRNGLKKVVLSRQNRIEFRDTVDPVDIMQRLSRKAGACFHFLLQGSDRTASFVGASPELLYERKGRELRTEAVAGTRSRGENAEEDRRLGEKLLTSEKELYEHTLVVESIDQSLASLADDITRSERSLMKLAKVQHLHCLISAVLREHIGDAEILKSLHPTAAVGGTPTEQALEKIEELEPAGRGWYAAPIGWIGRDEALFAVALRCGLVSGPELRLFSGAGIVRGSKPEAEWKELNKKLLNFTEAISENEI